MCLANGYLCNILLEFNLYWLREYLTLLARNLKIGVVSPAVKFLRNIVAKSQGLIWSAENFLYLDIFKTLH